MERIYPLGTRVLVLPDDIPMRTESGLYSTTEAHRELPNIGTVEEVGPGYPEDGIWVKPEVKIGDKVVFVKYAGTVVKLNGKDYVMLKETDILGLYRKG